MSKNVQYKIQMSQECLTRLNRLAARFGYPSSNKVAAQILQDYADLWERIEIAKSEAIAKEMQAFEEEINRKIKLAARVTSADAPTVLSSSADESANAPI